MDSAFVHARNLFEFLTERTTPSHYGCDAFDVSRLKSSAYQKHWKSPLHSYLMHAQDRTATKIFASYRKADPPKPLQDMPVDFGREAVRLWREFAKALGEISDPELPSLGPVADEVLHGCPISDLTVCETLSLAAAQCPGMAHRPHFITVT